ncbi:hypothetical protein FH972_005484 [Carpinus fangiana]|uniref:Uncharacterized protein n=1 Tax=Carpinus fangiana TaxID=176857 RepID=A0A5N6QQC9_9ROSI|nr:hypothetical protein FH972_005484 [Carpinus fangiana]
MLPHASKPGRRKCTTAAVLLDIIKDIEIAISCRKGRTRTAAGDVAFPKGKENLASVLKRYKRRLSNKPVGVHEGSALRKVPTSAPAFRLIQVAGLDFCWNCVGICGRDDRTVPIFRCK